MEYNIYENIVKGRGVMGSSSCEPMVGWQEGMENVYHEVFTPTFVCNHDNTFSSLYLYTCKSSLPETEKYNHATNYLLYTIFMTSIKQKKKVSTNRFSKNK